MDIKKFFSGKNIDRCMSKILFDFHDSQRKKIVFARSTLNWIGASVLLIVSSFVTILFLYPSYVQRILVHEEPIEMRKIPQRLEDDVGRESHLITTDVEIRKSKTAESNVITLDPNFVINPINLCATINHPNSEEYQRNPEIKLLILVQSAVDHFEERIAIRNTWGSFAERIQGPLRLGFVLDNDYEYFKTDNAINDLIHKESSEFRDVIQIYTIDPLPIVTPKSIFMLKWVITMCPHAEYFLKTEDDTFVNIHKIADILNNVTYTSENRFIAGHIKRKDSSVKLPQTDNDFVVDPPNYASGSYLMSIPTAIDLFDECSKKGDHFIEEDATITGRCAKNINVPLLHEPSFIIENRPVPPSWDTYSKLATVHGVTPDELEQLWEDLTKSIPNTLYYFETAINATGSFRRKFSV